MASSPGLRAWTACRLAVECYRWRQTTTDAREQNNTAPTLRVGGPVIKDSTKERWFYISQNSLYSCQVFSARSKIYDDATVVIHQGCCRYFQLRFIVRSCSSTVDYCCCSFTYEWQSLYKRSNNFNQHNKTAVDTELEHRTVPRRQLSWASCFRKSSCIAGLTKQCSILFITGPPNGPVLFCWLASVVVVVCNAAGRVDGRRVGDRAADTARRASTVTIPSTVCPSHASLEVS